MSLRTALAVPPLMVGAALVTCAVGQAAPDVVDMTYQDAATLLQRSGYSPVVVNTFGAQTQQANCLITRQQDRLADNARQTLLSLNCNAPIAAPGIPGNSAGSSVGRLAAAASVPRVEKAKIESSLVSQLATGPGPSWAQCSGDLVGTVGSSIDCTVLADQEKHTYALSVASVENGQISYNIASKD
jgi:hypothetical protein